MAGGLYLVKDCDIDKMWVIVKFVNAGKAMFYDYTETLIIFLA